MGNAMDMVPALALKMSFMSLEHFIGDYEILRSAADLKRNYADLAADIRSVYKRSGEMRYRQHFLEMLAANDWTHYTFIRAIGGELLFCDDFRKLREHLCCYVILLSKENVQLNKRSTHGIMSLGTLQTLLQRAYDFGELCETIDGVFQLIMPNGVVEEESREFALKVRDVSHPRNVSDIVVDDTFTETDLIDKLTAISLHHGTAGIWYEIKSILQEIPAASFDENPVEAFITTGSYHEWSN